MSMVLVTGGTGFVAGHVIAKLLEAGHDVRATARPGSKERTLENDYLTWFEADLRRDEGWREAAAGCDYVMHVASPMPAGAPKHEDDVIVPARDGVLRVLRAARDAKVQRVVLTSSCGAIYYGHPEQRAPFDETSWTNLESNEMSAYVKSKALAERAAWDFMEREGFDLELSVVNPAGIFGPALGRDYSPSLHLIGKLLDGMPGCPQLYFGVVDVRDVADLHVLAMTRPEAKNERFIAVSGEAMSMMDIARVLRSRLGERARKVPTRQLPNWLVRLMAKFDDKLPPLLPLLGQVRNATSAKAEHMFGWRPRSREDAVIATAESLLALGVAGPRDKGPRDQPGALPSGLTTTTT